MIRFPCPSCGRLMDVVNEAITRPVGCPHCRKEVSVPRLPDPGRANNGRSASPSPLTPPALLPIPSARSAIEDELIFAAAARRKRRLMFIVSLGAVSFICAGVLTLIVGVMLSEPKGKERELVKRHQAPEVHSPDRSLPVFRPVPYRPAPVEDTGQTIRQDDNSVPLSPRLLSPAAGPSVWGPKSHDAKGGQRGQREASFRPMTPHTPSTTVKTTPAAPRSLRTSVPSPMVRLNQRIKDNPKDPDAYLERGNLHFTNGNYDEAIADYNQAIQLDPDLSEAYTKRDAAYKKRLKMSRVPGYRARTIQGFHVFIASSVFAHNDDPEYDPKPLDVLEGELTTVSTVLPKRAVKVLRTVLIWVEWHDDRDPAIGKAVAKYIGAGGNLVLWGLTNNKHPLKGNSIDIIDMMALTKEHQAGVKVERCVLMHELAHAVHSQLFGSNNLHIKLAYRQAMEHHLYDTSRNIDGRPVKPYAGTNAHEYFAELTCAYFDRLNYFPFTREELRKYDPTGYRMMELVWGKPVEKPAK